MLKIALEKFAATWDVVKGKRSPIEITFQTLELYRPLFKYINGREIARLNLSDERILQYVGTHPELNRHQVYVPQYLIIFFYILYGFYNVDIINGFEI